MFESLEHIYAGYSITDILIDVVDVILVFYLIYRVLLLIKGTRAFQMLVGLLLVVVVYVVSQQDYFGLSTINWLLDKFIASFVVILVIIFQDDFRRGLRQVGRSSPLTGLSHVEQTHFLEEIVKAATLLGEQSIGALIVLEREASLDEYIGDGVRIDGAVTKELLISLFLPDRANLTHDGAVVIQKGRIAAAGCFLPLTTNPQVDRSLGTRHRAALGLSEHTDSIIIAVSEETGIVSVVFREELTRKLSTTELRDLLQKLFNEQLVQRQLFLRPRGLLQRLRMPRSSKTKGGSAKGQ